MTTNEEMGDAGGGVTTNSGGEQVEPVKEVKNEAGSARTDSSGTCSVDFEMEQLLHHKFVTQ